MLYPTLEAEPPFVELNTQDRVSKQSSAVLVYSAYMFSTSDEQNPVNLVIYLHSDGSIGCL